MTKKFKDMKGVIAIATTPFNNENTIDYESVDSLSEYYLESKVSGVTILGVMGEAHKLNIEEQKLLIKRYIKKLFNSVPVIVGVSNPGLDNLELLSKFSMDTGASGVMISGYNGLKNDDQIKNYFNQVIDRTQDIPICLQDYPPTTNVYFSESVINNIMESHPSIEMFKHEDCPGHNKLSRLLRYRDSNLNKKFSVFVGNGGLYVPQELERGADGIMTGFAFTEMLVTLYDLFFSDEKEKAEDLFDIFLPLIRHEQQFGIGLGLRKFVLQKRGIIKSLNVRSPGPILTKDDVVEINHLLNRLNSKLIEKGLPIPKGIN
ncbi:dihydrodipicolinate synthase family protein [Alphaproteobacteria bacterium]|jgi:4-hydroxy-tetrahydrodipicolinate synthase|nr:dihydrodipicolinate synthase family protein [Alphaproteobacteria bacterium]